MYGEDVPKRAEACHGRRVPVSSGKGPCKWGQGPCKQGEGPCKWRKGPCKWGEGSLLKETPANALTPPQLLILLGKRMIILKGLFIIPPGAGSLPSRILSLLSLFLQYLFLFGGHTHGIWKFPGWGSNRSCTCWPTPQPQ